MRKVWVYKRRNVKGYWVGWYESGKRKAKALPCKELAEHYKHIKYTQLNSDVFTGQVLDGVSTAVTQRLLEHSSPNLTNKVYTNVDPVLRNAVEQLQVENWL